MRRRVFLSPEFSSLSEQFVCVRMNAWLDELNVKRTRHMLGWHQNTAIALVHPDAECVSVDSFPGVDDCYWQMYNSMESQLRDHKEDESAQGARELLPAMTELAKLVQRTPAAADELPRLPVHPDLTQVFNLAACDSRMVVVQVDGVKDIEPHLRALVWDKELLGTAHYVRASAQEWREAIEAGQVLTEGPTADTGLFTLMPDTFGRGGEVLTYARNGASYDELRASMLSGLADFRANFKKLCRSEHFLVGLHDKIFWQEYGGAMVASSRMSED